ncbi:MAG: 4Fe-4S binding protein [Firmicutes bacterium]|nr:4Fe-4S binding protein [Bacillota bacterium]
MEDHATRGLLLEPGSAREYQTGDWRTIRPEWHPENCIHCLFCWVFCPDSAVSVKGGKMIGIDYDHCKGCGICAHECPSKPKALTMIPEE